MCREREHIQTIKPDRAQSRSIAVNRAKTKSRQGQSNLVVPKALFSRHQACFAGSQFPQKTIKTNCASFDAIHSSKP
jgi:hypothetical protein